MQVRRKQELEEKELNKSPKSTKRNSENEPPIITINNENIMNFVRLRNL